MNKYIDYSVNDKGTATVTLNRPDKKDALDLPMLIELREIFEKIKTNDAVKRIVLDSGLDDTFCAGLDYKNLRAEMSFDLPPEQKFAANLGASEAFAHMLDAVAACGKPKIGIVNGKAIGAGATLVALCDYVLASDDAGFAYPEWQMGLKPTISAAYVIARMGRDNAIRHFSSGRRFDVQEAQRMNMVDKICLAGFMGAAKQSVIAEFENGKAFVPKTLPDQVAAQKPNPDIVKLVDWAQALYADRSSMGRASLVAKTAFAFAKDRVKPATLERMQTYRPGR